MSRVIARRTAASGRSSVEALFNERRRALAGIVHGRGHSLPLALEVEE